MIDFTPYSTLKGSLSIQEWRKRYEELGLKTIPLNGKAPLDHESWKVTPTEIQWSRAGAKFNGNVGIVADDGIVMIDTDNLETANAVDCGLKSLSLTPLAVSTPRAKHFYQRVTGVPEGFNSARLMPELYKGELRARNSYVVAPCSQINGIPYLWENGTPEDLQTQTVVEWKDLSWLLPNRPVASLIEELPIRLLYRDMPYKAKDLLEKLAGATKGQVIEKYESRSEAEAAVITMLILAGWSYNQILDAFETWSPGKYHEAKGRDRQKYFDKTYFKMLSKLAAHPTRLEIANSWEAVNSNPFWLGANGYLRRDTCRGLLAICWQFRSWEVSAAERDLAEYAAASQAGIHNSLVALAEQGIIQKVSRGSSFGNGTRWRVNPVENVSSEVMIYDNFSPEEPYEIAEIWAHAKLGRTAGTIYRLLNTEPISIRHLSKITGKARSSVKLALENKLAKSHLAKSVAEGWIRGTGTLMDVAEAFETKKAVNKRRSYHRRERDAYVKLLAMHKKPEKPKWR